MTDWQRLDTFEGAGGDVTRVLAQLRSRDRRAAWGAVEALSTMCVSLPERHDPPFCSAQAPLCDALLGMIEELLVEIQSPVLLMVGDIVAANHYVLLKVAPDVESRLEELHRTALGGAVAGAVRGHMEKLVALSTHEAPSTRAAALVVLALLPGASHAVARARCEEEPDATVRKLACFVAGMNREARVEEPFFSWLGSTLHPPALAVPADLHWLSEVLPQTTFPILDGKLAAIVSARAQASADVEKRELAGLLLTAVEQGLTAIAEEAVSASIAVREVGIRPEQMTALEARAVDVASALPSRIEAFRRAGIPADPAQRASWAQATPPRVLDRPAPAGLEGAAPNEPLGAALFRIAGENRLPQAIAALRELVSPADHAAAVAAIAKGEHNLVLPEAALLREALLAAGMAGAGSARELLGWLGLTGDRFARGNGSIANAALLGLARAEGWETLPAEWVPYVKIEGFREGYLELLQMLPADTRKELVRAFLDRVKLERINRRRIEDIAYLLSMLASETTTRAFLARAKQTPAGEKVAAEVAAIAKKESLVVPGLGALN